MPAIPPVHALDVDQSEIRLVDERCRLQAVTGTLAFHVAACQAAELVVHDGGQPFERALVSVAPGAEECADIAHSRLLRRPGFRTLGIIGGL